MAPSNVTKPYVFFLQNKLIVAEAGGKINKEIYSIS